MQLPEKFQINAYDPGAAAAGWSPVPADADLWALKNQPGTLSFLASQEPADPRDWADPKVGWGLIVPDNPDCRGEDSARLEDYRGDPIRGLWEARGAGPVFRYRKRPDRLTLLWSARDRDDVLLSASPVGTGQGALPRYLLIYGGPEQIPWDLQYVLQQNTNCFVGRLPLVGAAAENYVRAAINDFKDCKAKKSAAVVWAPLWDEEGEYGITRLMRDAIAAPVYDKLRTDSEVNALFLDGLKKEASAARLLDELKERAPAFLVTTSHGQTGPLQRPDAMRAALGVPLDQAGTPLRPEALPQEWEPAGAIWYAHACCSAGSDEHTSFEYLLAPDSDADRIVRAVAALGSHVSPLPLKLLQAERPLRAFIGHVEPTFDYTLRYPFKPTEFGVPGTIDTTAALQEALYDGLYRAKPEPVGLALRRLYNQMSGADGIFNGSLREFQKGRDQEMTPNMIWARLTSNDIKTTVILGDPAVTLPA